MFSKLVFTIKDEKNGEQQIEFHAHEVVKIAQQVVSEIEVEPVIIPDYKSHAKQLEKRIEFFMEKIIYLFEEHFNFHQYVFKTKYGYRKHILFHIFMYLYKAGTNNFLTSDLFGHYRRLINELKGKERPRLIQDELEEEILLPPNLTNINTVAKWLFVAKHISDFYKDSPVVAWWLKIADRLILLRNVPAQRQHFYVSDHGFTKDVTQNVKKSLFQFTPEGRAQFSAAVKFWKEFYEQAAPDKRKILKNHFIQMLNQDFGGDEDRNLFLLFTLSLPKSMQGVVLQKGKLDLPWSSHVGLTDQHHSEWLQPVSAEKELNATERETFEKVFDSLIERIRYMSQIQARTVVNLTFGQALGPFFTQIDQIFHPDDAQKYKIYLVLAEIAKSLGEGYQEFLFRPVHSFGSREEGDSYRSFADAFELYFTSSQPLPEYQLATVMREALRGKPLTDERLYFLPNLIAAWFVSEVARNNVSILSGLMLLDLIESNVQLMDGEGNNLYSWKHVLIHPKKPLLAPDMPNIKIPDLYGKMVKLDEFDGSHPMAHHGSSQDSKKELCDGQKLSSVRQKEGSIILHWLYENLKKTHPAIKAIMAKDSWLINSPNYDEIITTNSNSEALDGVLKKIKKINGTIGAKRKKDVNADVKKEQKQIVELNKQQDTLVHKQNLQRDVIEPLLRQRLMTLDNLLSPPSLTLTVDEKTHKQELDTKNIDSTEFLIERNDNQQLGWNCFDVAVGLPEELKIEEANKEKRAKAARAEIVKFALDEKNIEEFRQLLAPEIRNAVVLTTALMNVREERAKEAKVQTNSKYLEELFYLLDIAHEHGDEYHQQEVIDEIGKSLSLTSEDPSQKNIKNFTLPSSMYTLELKSLFEAYEGAHEAIKPIIVSCSEALGRGRRKSFDELSQYFVNNDNQQIHQKTYKRFKYAKSRIENALKAVAKELGNGIPNSSYTALEAYFMNEANRDNHICAYQKFNKARKRRSCTVIDCNESLNIKGLMSLKELDEFFEKVENRKEHPAIYKQFNEARNKLLTPAEQKLNEYCSRVAIFKQYIKDYYGKHQWFAFQPTSAGNNNTSMVDIVARRLNKRIVIYQQDGTQWKEIYRTQQPYQSTIHIQYNHGHFVALKENITHRQGVADNLRSIDMFKMSDATSNKLDESTKPLPAEFVEVFADAEKRAETTSAVALLGIQNFLFFVQSRNQSIDNPIVPSAANNSQSSIFTPKKNHNSFMKKDSEENSGKTANVVSRPETTANPIATNSNIFLHSLSGVTPSLDAAASMPVTVASASSSTDYPSMYNKGRGPLAGLANKPTLTQENSNPTPG